MNQLCKVCGEPAAGFHFGAFTCEGCKSFFGRTYNNISSISECKKQWALRYQQKNRTACKACRLRKCLLVGMSKSGSRYGRRSNWFKIHCLLQEQQQAGGHLPGVLRSHPYLPLPLFRNPLPTDTKSSESDSGASSADIEEEMRSSSALSSFRLSNTSPATSERSTVSVKKLPSPSSDSEYFARKRVSSFTIPPSPSSVPPNFPRWPTFFPNIPVITPDANCNTWSDVWLRGTLPAPQQEQPIDLSVRAINTKLSKPEESDEQDFNIDVGVDKILKPAPLDLTLVDRQADVITTT